MFSNCIIWEYFIYTSTEQQSRSKDVLVKTQGYTDIKVKIYIRNGTKSDRINQNIIQGKST